MRPQDAVDRKPEIVSPATPISTPTSTFNPNSTVSELILTLRSCFQLQDFEEVAAILQSREDKLKQNFTGLKNREDKLNLNNFEIRNQLQNVTDKCASLEANRENFAVEKERIETELKKFKAEREKFGVEKERIQAELKKCKADCDVYRDDKVSMKYEVERVKLELEMWREKEGICVERYENRIAELEKERKDESEGMRVEILKLQEDLEKGKDEIVGLVDGKKKAEELATYWEDQYKQVEAKVMKLENDMGMIFASYPVLGKSVEKLPLLRNPPAINPKSVNYGNPELVERQKQSNLSKCDANAHASPCAGSTAESQLVNTNGRAEAVSTKAEMMKRQLGKADRRVAEIAARQNKEPEPHTERGLSPAIDIIDTMVDLEVEAVSAGAGGGNPQKRARGIDDTVVRTYHPEWSVLDTDQFAARAPVEAKEVGVDLCRAFILPADRPVYAGVGAASACTELIGHLTMAVPWAAAIEEKVRDMEVRLKSVQLVEDRAIMAEGQVESLQNQVAELKRHVSTLETERDAVRTDMDAFIDRSRRRTERLRASRKAEKKAQKLLMLTEDRCYSFGFDDAVQKAHAAGLDYKLLLDDGVEDPITRPEKPNVVPVVSSDPETDLSN